jgi:hypothetical protein
MHQADPLPYYLFLSISVAITAVAWLAAPSLIARELAHWELGVLAALAWGAAHSWRKRLLRKRRECIEQLRDSALW